MMTMICSHYCNDNYWHPKIKGD